ncbi:hypothetical protein I0D00_18420 [Pseudomonas lalucatii]|uniref:Uncharacterized protein n=1 Tax=Pseudomonas lalucatii TaxID=1424203 RepID=A0ABS5Q572_9PSED|nr:hypothetical protein [Pseudomonas lalucatii]MBS7663906.1 hypothetical protein [Pseudomonas lalucatii]MBS7725282.1 hypothetical protein [Pseudomonas lalucatii]QVM86760.1 hypothetical protein I0D68_13605 [Pseudomonas lalucatii]
MGSRACVPLVLALLGFGLFSAASQWRTQVPEQAAPVIEGRVVIAAPVLLALFGGDRFLAANLETMRLAATGVDFGRADTGYLVRAQQEVAKLNACHEDNYYLANGLLTWGGADREGTEVLRRAMQCRFWDELPAFFYGFNQAFFNKDIAEASRALELAAQRATGNAAGFRKLAVMLQAERFADEKLALDYLTEQRDAARDDPKLHAMLDKRVARLQGLVALREAQRRFEGEHGALQALEQLVEYELLSALPEDPLRLGYELTEGRIVLKKLKVAGMEEQP